MKFPEAAKYFFLKENGLQVRAQGNSMAPAISDGQSVPISRDIGRLRRGTCYFFFLENNFLLHRLVYASNNKAVFMGDNSDVLETVDAGAIVARLAGREPPLRANIIMLINDGYYILKSVFPWQLLRRIRKRLIKITSLCLRGRSL